MPVEVRGISSKLTYRQFISLPVIMFFGLLVSESKFQLRILCRVVVYINV